MNDQVQQCGSEWDKLKAYPVPKWFRDAKFGIFIHWGPYAVPGWSDETFLAEWYPTHMYRKESPAYAYHRKTWGDVSEFGYKEFIPMFKGEHFDATKWAD
ncbi:MAG: alpha-L-fucosidase, partial [Chlorobiales bacterium]|nr:alpha-L-fucosidase [Chlorobiales bacterium]